MTNAAAPVDPPRTTPVHLWVVGVLSTLWNAFGVFDFTMTVTRNPAYLAQFPADMVDWLDAAPAWSIAVWALGTVGALAGSVLLLLRSRLAFIAFALSLTGLALNQVWQWSAGMPPSMLTATNITITVVIWVIAILLLDYARRMRRQGVLR